MEGSGFGKGGRARRVHRGPGPSRGKGRESLPNWPRIDSKSAPTPAPKSTPNRSRSGPNSAPNRPEIEPKQAQHRLQIGFKSGRNQPRGGLGVVLGAPVESRGVLEGSRGAPGATWGAPGGLLGASRGSRGVLGGVMGGSREDLGALWGGPGGSSGGPGGIPGSHGRVLGGGPGGSGPFLGPQDPPGRRCWTDLGPHGGRSWAPEPLKIVVFQLVVVDVRGISRMYENQQKR